ncbi:TolC family protein [Polynucleobacter asymbioticus]|uniref:TolC family protein n=1 Tax=Polynucleobacter asymbioticus TaxID=576611 RepID=UPI001BFD1F50|nr:TolC family protein [Polynucleobacter asymbioticus]QWD85850.1 TolC family protein [Polynucleobacter asymbioticus]
MRTPLIRLSAALGASLISSVSLAQSSASGLNEYTPIPLAQYLQVVKENNAIIGNKRLGKETAAAIKESLALYQFRPSVSYTKGTFYQQVPYTPYSTPTSNTYGVNFNLEGWGKRSARSEYGDAEIGRSETDYQATEADVQTVATLGYVDALRNRLLFNSYAKAAKRISTLPANAQTKDSAQFLQYYENASAKDLQFTSLSLLNYSGGALKNLPLPIGNLNVAPQAFDPDKLINQALNSRSDILALQAAMNSAEKNISMTKANRNWDVMPYVSYTTTPQYDSSGYTYAPQNGFSAGIQIPLPVSNFLQNADIVQAANQKLGIEMQLRDLKEQVRVQVMQALLQYESAKQILAQANDGLNGVSKTANQSSAKGVMDVRDKEGALIDAQTNHVKALVNIWRQSGNYSMPPL